MPRPVLIVLPDGYADWETPLISAAAGSFFGLSVRHATPGGGDITSMAGLCVTGLPDVVPAEDEVIVICGGDRWLAPDAPDLSAILRAAHARGQTVAGICAGTVVLGRAGLLEAVAHTSNGRDFLDHYLPGLPGRERYQDGPAAVSDGGVVTAAGTAPVSFAQAVLTAAGVPEAQTAEMRALFAAELGAA